MPPTDYYKTHKEQCDAYQCRYRIENKEKYRATTHAYYERNKEYFVLKHKNWVLDNPKKVKNYKLKYLAKKKAARDEKRMQRILLLIPLNDALRLRHRIRKEKKMAQPKRVTRQPEESGAVDVSLLHIRMDADMETRIKNSIG